MEKIGFGRGVDKSWLFFGSFIKGAILGAAIWLVIVFGIAVNRKSDNGVRTFKNAIFMSATGRASELPITDTTLAAMDLGLFFLEERKHNVPFEKSVANLQTVIKLREGGVVLDSKEVKKLAIYFGVKKVSKWLWEAAEGNSGTWFREYMSDADIAVLERVMSGDEIPEEYSKPIPLTLEWNNLLFLALIQIWGVFVYVASIYNRNYANSAYERDWYRLPFGSRVWPWCALLSATPFGLIVALLFGVVPMMRAAKNLSQERRNFRTTFSLPIDRSVEESRARLKRLQNEVVKRSHL